VLKNHSTKMLWGVEMKFHTFLTSTPDEDE
jgi:hypothetical protein